MNAAATVGNDYVRSTKMQIKDAVLLLDHRGFFDSNATAVKMFGCVTKEQLYGKYINEVSPLFQPDGKGSASLFQDYIRSALGKGNCCFEWSFTRSDQSEFLAEVVLTAIEINKHPALQMTLRDAKFTKKPGLLKPDEQPTVPMGLSTLDNDDYALESSEPVEYQNLATSLDKTISLERQLSEQAALLEAERAERTAVESSLVQLGAALESASDAISITDSYGVATYVNTAFHNLFGYSLLELQTFGVLPSLFPNPVVAETVFKVVSNGGSWRDEVEMCDREGRIIPIALRVDGIKDTNGEVIGLVGIYTDISDRKQIETEIDRTLSLLTATLEATADGILVVDRDGKSVICNQKFVELWRFPASVSITHEDDNMMNFILQQLETPDLFLQKTREITGQLNAESHDLLRCKDGRTIEIYSQPQRVNGLTVGRVWSFRDITQRVAAEEALRSSEAKFREQAQKLEQTLYELQQTQSQLIQNEKMSSLGQLVAGIAHEINNPVNFIHGNVAHANRYAQDLLRLLNLYQHHYPEPVDEITQEAEAIELEFLSQDLPKLLASMKVGADRIQQIVLSLRNFSRMDEAEFKAVDIHDGIDSTLMILQNRIKARPDRGQIEIIKEYGNLPLVECYAGQLNQVFMNILSNALDALEEAILTSRLSPLPNFADQEAITLIENQERSQTKDREVLLPNHAGLTLQNKLSSNLTPIPTIRICTASISDAKTVVISIADNGMGIPELVKQKLFDPFFTTKPVGKGTGLGLSISYQIVTEKHKGKLQCNSGLGQGTEFVIQIPVNQRTTAV